MAGLIAWVGPGIESARGRFAATLASLRHDASFTPAVVAADGRALLGGVSRRARPLDVDEAACPGVVVAVHGTVLWRRGAWLPASAAELAAAYAEGGAERLCGAEGSYVIAVLDRRAGLLRIITDRLGTLPVAHARGDGWFACGPEAKAVLAPLGAPPRIDAAAAAAFLGIGYPIGDRTMLESVRLLPPACCASVELASGRATIATYWQLAFRPDPRIGRREAAHELADRVLEAHRAVLADRPPATALLLTGGLDSRTVLGALEAVGTPPGRAVTWAAVEGVPGSDPEVARRLAAACAVPHAVATYGAASFVDHAREWCRVSELGSENLGDFAAGPALLSATLAPGTVVLIGDQMIGPGGLPLSRGQAIEQACGVRPGRLPVALARAAGARAKDLAASLHGQIDAVAAGCPAQDPKDLHDGLYFHLYVRRWLLAPAYFREPMVEARRPLLANAVVDLVTTLPPWLRVDKRALADVLRARMPRLARIPAASANSLVDWGYEARRPGALRERLLALLQPDRLAATPAGALLDLDLCRTMVNACFSAAATPVRRAPSWRARLLPLRRAAAGSRLATMALARAETAARGVLDRPATGSWPVVRRLALLALLQEVIDGGDLGPPADAGTAHPTPIRADAR